MRKYKVGQEVFVAYAGKQGGIGIYIRKITKISYKNIFHIEGFNQTSFSIGNIDTDEASLKRRVIRWVVGAEEKG